MKLYKRIELFWEDFSDIDESMVLLFVIIILLIGIPLLPFWIFGWSISKFLSYK